MTTKLEAKLARIEVQRAQRRHRPVIEYRNPADVPRLLAEAEAAGRIARTLGVLVVPEDATDAATWERRVREGHYRDSN